MPILLETVICVLNLLTTENNVTSCITNRARQ